MGLSSADNGGRNQTRPRHEHKAVSGLQAGWLVVGGGGVGIRHVHAMNTRRLVDSMVVDALLGGPCHPQKSIAASPMSSLRLLASCEE